MTAPAPAVGVALAGGQSRRMGRDKTTLGAGLRSGASLLQWTVERLGQACSRVVVADRGRGPTSVADGPGMGPVAGILGAAEALPGEPLLVLATDLPAVPAELLKHLVALRQGGAKWIVPRRGGHFEPLCSLYTPEALIVLRRQVGEGRFSLQRLAETGLHLHAVEGEELDRFGGGELFLNINTMQDYRRWLERVGGEPPR